MNIYKKPNSKNVLPTDPNKKVRLTIYYKKFKTSHLIIPNNISPFLKFLTRQTSYIYSNVPWKSVYPKKIMRMLVLPSSSCHTASADLPNPPPPPFSIVDRSW